MPRLSVIMIVKDEELWLADCLSSVRDIADELVIGDTGSTDGSREIARSWGAMVFDLPWTADFAAARNATIAAASGDWLLHLDADEALDATGAARIRALVDADGEGADAVELTLANYCNTPRAWRWTPVTANDPHARGYAGYIKTTLLRLFRANRGFEYREPVHENITASVRERNGRILSTDILIHHYGYAVVGPRAEAKKALYLDIAKRKRAEHPDDIKALQDFAEQAFACGLAEESEQVCRDALALDDAFLPAAMLLANLLLIRSAFEEAEVVLRGLESTGNATPHVVTALAAITCRDGRLEEALARANTVLDAEPLHLMARLYRARIHDRMGRYPEAHADLETACAQAPGMEEIRNRVQAHALRLDGEKEAQRGNIARSLELFARALSLDKEDPYIHNDLGVALQALGETARAERAFRHALQLAPTLSEALDNLKTLGRAAPA